MKRFMNKKVVTIGVAVGLTLGIAGAAFAYWTNTGHGSGSGSTGAVTANSITIADNGPFTNLGPGTQNDASVTVTFTDHDAYNEYVTNVTVTLTGTTGCPASNYTINDTPYTAPVVIPVGVETTPSVALVETGLYKLGFNDESGTNQNACQTPPNSGTPELAISYSST